MADHDLFCENCHQPLDPTDKFCRQCGLPTLHRAEAQTLVAGAPPDTVELARNLEVEADPSPFLREDATLPAHDVATQTPTTGNVIRATSPTQAVSAASITIIMVGLIVFMVLAGAALLILAVR
jgi:hypothetical protein